MPNNGANPVARRFVITEVSQPIVEFSDCRSFRFVTLTNHPNVSRALQEDMEIVEYLRNVYVLLKHMRITLKLWVETRWESRIKSIQELKYQAEQVSEAFLEVKKAAADPVVRVERHCVCYGVLCNIQYVSKLMQSLSMPVGVAVNLLKHFLTTYRKIGVAAAQIFAKQRHFVYEFSDEPMQEANHTFAVLHELTNLGREDLLEKCQTVSASLTHDSQLDIDGMALTKEIEYFPPLPSNNMTSMEILAFLHATSSHNFPKHVGR
ncbi:unnamed protein product [Lepeophtheirus salmonis]|uniref:(salmon louse) hypothetical protein n=1 Tax=Lepeophtheirus salmonis TaxID=72036 RepID=A0A7R8CN94_LEPSM|nr:unnamed protein product [Lepeophtheirus salmonis]CAF2827927.1 unnamed protein product [Lepeophtheirus salmonis]